MENIMELEKNIAISLLRTDTQKDVVVDLCDSAADLVALYRKQCRTTSCWQKEVERLIGGMSKLGDTTDTIPELQNRNAQLRAEVEALRTLLATIQTEAERFPVPGGYTYAISGELMGRIDKVMK